MGRWESSTIGGHATDTFEPATPSAGVVLFLHDYDLRTPRDDAAFTGEFERRGLRVVCPHAGKSWWLRRPCAEFDTAVTPMDFARDAVTAEIERRWGLQRPAIGLVGIGMGGQGALQLAYRFPREFPVVAAIAPLVDFHEWHGRSTALDEMFATREAARQETATLHVHPLNWPPHQLIVCDPQDTDCFEGCERLASKLASTGIPFERDFETSRGGHTWEYFCAMAPRAIGFVTERLGAR
jgi:S-formylglutathione hydrolase